MGRRKSEVQDIPSYLKYVQPLDEWHYYKHGRTRVALFRCTYKDCGKLVKRIPAEVNNKTYVSCGCKKKDYIKTKLSQRCNYAGKIVGRWRIIAHIGKKRGYLLWSAICLECGEKIEISTEQISRDMSPCRCRQKRAMIKWGREYRIVLRMQEETLLKEQKNAGNASGNRGVARPNRKTTKISSVNDT
jgi:hypothetical protein